MLRDWAWSREDSLLPRLIAWWDRIRTSLWFLPGIMIVAAMLLAWLALNVSVDMYASRSVWWLNQASAKEASELLSALLGSLITMATLVVSITMVVLTLAAGQLGPRLIRTFVADRRTQSVIGLFIGTIVYILLIFRLVDSTLPKDAVPHFAVTAASVLMFICLLVLIYFVHHLSRSIVADTMINRVGHELDLSIQQNLGDPDEIPTIFVQRSDDAPARYALPESGYVQGVHYRLLADTAAEHNAFMELLVRPGHHVLRGRTHAHVWPVSALTEDFRSAIAGAVAIGGERTPVQDIEFSIRQLVEMALRALSPGINDPFTAIAVIDRLSASLALAMERGEARKVWSGADETVRLVAATSSFEGLVDLCFNQIRQAAAGHVDVLTRLVDVLAQLAQCTRTDEQARILERHLDLVMETGRHSIGTPADLACLEARRRESAPTEASDGPRP